MKKKGRKEKRKPGKKDMMNYSSLHTHAVL